MKSSRKSVILSCIILFALMVSVIFIAPVACAKIISKIWQYPAKCVAKRCFEKSAIYWDLAFESTGTISDAFIEKSNVYNGFGIYVLEYCRKSGDAESVKLTNDNHGCLTDSKYHLSPSLISVGIWW